MQARFHMVQIGWEDLIFLLISPLREATHKLFRCRRMVLKTDTQPFAGSVLQGPEILKSGFSYLPKVGRVLGRVQFFEHK